MPSHSATRKDAPALMAEYPDGVWKVPSPLPIAMPKVVGVVTSRSSLPSPSKSAVGAMLVKPEPAVM